MFNAIISSGWRKYLILLPILFLVGNALFFKHASQEIEQALLQEKYFEIEHSIEALAASVEATTSRVWSDNESNIIHSVEYIDRLYQVYGGAYKLIDEELILITQRYYETSIFEPLDFEEFATLVNEQDFGRLIIGYTPENQEYRELYLCFRWMPLYSPAGERYLVVAGVSKYSIESEIPYWISYGQWISTLFTFSLNTVLVLLVIRMGFIYASREGDKWRGRR